MTDHRPDDPMRALDAVVRIDTPVEVEYIQHGGILQRPDGPLGVDEDAVVSAVHGRGLEGLAQARDFKGDAYAERVAAVTHFHHEIDGGLGHDRA